MEYTSYRLEKRKVAFEKHYLVDTKLLKPTFNHLKFYAITYFVQYISDYRTTINNDTANNSSSLIPFEGLLWIE